MNATDLCYAYIALHTLSIAHALSHLLVQIELKGQVNLLINYSHNIHYVMLGMRTETIQYIVCLVSCVQSEGRSHNRG